MKMELSQSYVGFGQVSIKNWVVSLPLTAAALMEDVNVGHVEAENTNGGGADLSSAEKNAYEQLEIAMKSVGMVYDVTVQEMLKALEQSAKM